MNLAQKIGQLLVVGFDGIEVTKEIKHLIEHYHVGNIILFERNCKTPEQIFKLVQELQRIAMACNGVPLFVTIDQENGIVTRINEGVTVFPGSMAQSAGATLAETEMIAHYTGRGLSKLGINFNLAPSVDINNNPHNPVIGVRSFGETGEQVAKRAVAYIKGLQESGVIATAKHFPGHGDTNTDSHLALPTVTHDKARLDAVELYPFKEAIKHGVKAIMSAHIKFPAYEPDDLPATLSYNVLTKLLRETLGFNGIVITDCMEMKAIDTHYGTAAATPMAIAAGADLVCLSHEMKKQIDAIQAIYTALESGKLTEARIDTSIQRLLAVKQQYPIAAFLDLTYEEAKKELYQDTYEALAQKISCKSITMIRNSGLVPITAKKILVVAPNGRVLTGADGTIIAPNFAKVFLKRVKGREVEAVEIDNAPTTEQINRVVEKAKQAELVILCTHNGILSPRQLDLGKCIYAVQPHTILIPMRNPYDSEALAEIPTCLLPYEYTVRSMGSLIDVLMGEREAEGKLPITLHS